MLQGEKLKVELHLPIDSRGSSIVMQPFLEVWAIVFVGFTDFRPED
jgi:hypothetical protein